jgi:hypothetical protein
MADVDELTRRTTTLVTGLATKAMRLAAGVAVVVLIVGGLSYLTGLAGLDGSARSLWTVLGLIMLVVAVGAPLRAWWRLAAVSKKASALAGDIRTLITRDADARRVVIETVAVDKPPPAGGRELRPAVYDSRQIHRLRTVTVKASDLRELPGAIRAVTTFPWLLGLALLGVLVFGLLGFLFLLAWIF